MSTKGSSKDSKGTKKSKKVKRQVLSGLVHIKSSFNNTIIAFTDVRGNLLAISTTGSCGFKNTKQSSPYAAAVATEQAINNARYKYGIKQVKIIVSGFGQGRDSAIRTILNSGLGVDSLIDKTTIAHGGVRAKKARRN